MAHIPQQVQDLVNDLKRTNAGAYVLASRLDEQSVMVELRDSSSYSLAAFRYAVHKQVSLKSMTPGLDQLCCLIVDIDKAIA